MRTLIAGLMALALAGCIPDHDTGVQVKNPNIPQSTPNPRVSAAYFTLHNYDEQAVTLVGATSTCFGAIEVHETSVDEHGTFSMNRLSEIVIPGRSAVEFKRQGKHLMLFRRACTDDKIEITLTFKSGKTLPVEFLVNKLYSEKP